MVVQFWELSAEFSVQSSQKVMLQIGGVLVFLLDIRISPGSITGVAIILWIAAGLDVQYEPTKN